MARPLRGILPAVLVVLAAACASTNTRAGTANPPITADELAQGRYTSVYDAVERLRPAWLRNLMGSYINGQRAPAADLRTTPVQGVAEIKLISSEEATTKYNARALAGNFLEIRTGE